MSEYTSFAPKTPILEKPLEEAAVHGRSSHGPLCTECVTISAKQRAQILELIARGENLNVRDLEAFYHWIDDSYKALKFHALQQQRFEEYCRSSSDSDFMRIFIGVWILRLALG